MAEGTERVDYDDCDGCGPSEAFFENMGRMLQREFEAQLNAYRLRLRRGFDDALDQECRAFQASLRSAVASLPSNASTVGDAAATTAEEHKHATTEDSSSATTKVFAEAASLQHSLLELSRVPRPHVEHPDVAYEPAVVSALQEIARLSSDLKTYAEQRLASLKHEFVAENLSGESYAIQTFPCLQTVNAVKQKLAQEYQLKTSCSVQLCANGGAVLMRGPDKLMDYELMESPATLVLTASTVANLKLQLPFDNPEDLAFDVVSGVSGVIKHPGCVWFVDTLGRTGANFTGLGVLELPHSVELGAAWTLSVWALFPMEAGQTYRDLVDGEAAQSFIAVILRHGELGSYCRREYVHDFNVSSLSDGWHHLAVVSADEFTTYYVDGEAIGTTNGQDEGQVRTVGNTPTGGEAWGVMSDLRIFGAAATAEEIKSLFE